jgi:hypothetical protein
MANAAVVDLLRSSLAATVRTVSEHDRVEPFDGGTERLWTCEIADDHFRILR